MNTELTPRVLVVDDDGELQDLMSSFLQKHGIQADGAADVPAMRRRMSGARYDLIILDLMMPGEGGLSALQRLQGPEDPPVIIVSAIAEDVDRIVGLEMGAQDYLSKPCNPRELLARIRAVLRRRWSMDAPAEQLEPANDDEETLSFAGWRLAKHSRLLFDPEGVVINLSDGEFRLLAAFAERPKRVLTRDQLLDYSRGSDSTLYDRAIDVQISRLRKKLRDGGGRDLIRTVRSEGYMFMPDVTRGRAASARPAGRIRERAAFAEG